MGFRLNQCFSLRVTVSPCLRVIGLRAKPAPRLLACSFTSQPGGGGGYQGQPARRSPSPFRRAADQSSGNPARLVQLSLFGPGVWPEFLANAFGVRRQRRRFGSSCRYRGLLPRPSQSGVTAAALQDELRTSEPPVSDRIIALVL